MCGARRLRPCGTPPSAPEGINASARPTPSGTPLRPFTSTAFPRAGPQTRARTPPERHNLSPDTASQTRRRTQTSPQTQGAKKRRTVNGAALGMSSLSPFVAKALHRVAPFLAHGARGGTSLSGVVFLFRGSGSRPSAAYVPFPPMRGTFSAQARRPLTFGRCSYSPPFLALGFGRVMERGSRTCSASSRLMWPCSTTKSISGR